MDVIKEGILASAKAAEAAARLGESLFGGKEMKFNSQICTTREQSERLLSLGLKKETADMQLAYSDSFKDGVLILPYPPDEEGDIPAWSFARLLEIFMESDRYRNILFVNKEDHMEYLIRHIEVYIRNGYIDKKVLE